jgi:hypothetical protein
VARTNKESVNDHVKGESTTWEILKDEIKLESERTAVDEEVENSQILLTCTGPAMISQEFDIKTEDVAAYLQSQDFAVAHQSTAVRTHEESVMVDTKNMNTPVVSQENYYPLKRTLLMEDVVKELKPKSKQIKRIQDTDKELTVLQTEKIRKFIPTEMFVFEAKTIKIARDTKDSNKGRKETNSSKKSEASHALMPGVQDSPTINNYAVTKSNKSRILQDEFLCMAECSPAVQNLLLRDVSL